MPKNPHQEALQHALDALSDGSGHAIWGPGPILCKLDKVSAPAASAFELSTQVAMKMHHLGREKMIATMRAIAPVLLEVIQGDG